jgi:hypothetical protein
VVTLLLVAWLAMSAVVSAGVWWAASRESIPRGPAFLLAAMVFAAVAVLPHEVQQTAQRIREYQPYTRTQADRAGALEVGVNPQTFDRVAEIVPPNDTIFVRGAGRFTFWAFTSLLPRTAVDAPSKAQWILQPRTPPTSAGSGVAIGRVYKVGPSTYLARVVQ